METAYSVINYNPTTKEQAEVFANKLTEEVLQGEVNPLELHVKMSAMQKAFDAVKKNIASLVLEEAQKYGEKSFEAMNAKIEIQELGVKYDFSGCGDYEWEMLDAREKATSDAKKEREKFLKSLTKSMTIVNEGTGEIEMVRPPVKSSTTGIKVTLK